MKKFLPYLLILVLLVVLFFVRRAQNTDTDPKTKKDTEKKSTATEKNRNRGFDRRTEFLEYTLHAKCRMQCRHITQEEVKDIMRNGKINYSKSNVNAHPCPEYALEGTTDDNQRVRIIFAQCDYKTKVVTCIDLGKDWTCDCPGDDKQHGNKQKN